MLRQSRAHSIEEGEFRESDAFYRAPRPRRRRRWVGAACVGAAALVLAAMACATYARWAVQGALRAHGAECTTMAAAAALGHVPTVLAAAFPTLLVFSDAIMWRPAVVGTEGRQQSVETCRGDKRVRVRAAAVTIEAAPGWLVGKRMQHVLRAGKAACAQRALDGDDCAG